MTYTIGDFSKLTNLGIHTLRYYEKENLLDPKRLPNGRRLYSEQDLTWVQFIKRLKDTGMPIKEIQKYAYLRAKGQNTLKERMDMLIQHRLSLINEIKILNDHLINLNNKIEYYHFEITKKSNVKTPSISTN